MLEASAEFLESNEGYKQYHVVGWNDQCRKAYNESRKTFLDWKFEGKIRDGPKFEAMKCNRAIFRRALRFCKQHELQIRKANLIKAYSQGSKVNFWKRIRQIAPKQTTRSSCIDGLTDTKDIANMFSEKYKTILAGSVSQSNLENITSGCVPSDEKSRVFFHHNLEKAINSLNPGSGWDQVDSNHLKYSGGNFRFTVSRFFGALLRHNHMPKNMLMGEIKPIVKDNKISAAKSDNYRPIMNSSVLFKTFEYCLLPRLRRDIDLNPRQFGFREQTSCLLVISVSK